MDSKSLITLSLLKKRDPQVKKVTLLQEETILRLI